MLFNRCCNRQMPMMMNGGYPQNNCMEQQIVKPTITKCVEKEFYHEVPHVCPIHTHVINRHVYKHTYTPQYSCSEENQIINNDCGNCQGLANGQMI